MLGTLVPLSALIGTRRLCLILWTARNPASLPTLMNSVLSLLRTLETFSNLLGTLRLCLFIWTDQNPDSLPAFMKSSIPWFFAWFSELTCICCIAQILSCFHTWNSVLSLDGTLESFSVLLGTLRLCQILWTVRNPASMSAFMKSSELWYFACFY